MRSPVTDITVRFNEQTHRITGRPAFALGVLLDQGATRDGVTTIGSQPAVIGTSPGLPEGLSHFVVVRQVKPGMRLRLFLIGTTGADTDVSEEIAHVIFEEAARNYPAVHDVERQLEASFEGDAP